MGVLSPSGLLATATADDFSLNLPLAESAIWYEHGLDEGSEMDSVAPRDLAVDRTIDRDVVRQLEPRKPAPVLAAAATVAPAVPPAPVPTPEPAPEPTPDPTPVPAPVDPVTMAIEWWSAYLGYTPESLLTQPIEFSAWPSYEPCQGVSDTGCTSWERDYVWVNNTFGSDMTAMVAHEFGHVLGYENNASGPAIMQYANWNNAPYDCWSGVDQHC